MNDHQLAARLAAEAGDLLLEIRRSSPLDAAQPGAMGAIGDRRSQELLATRLRELRPDDAVLSEEAPDDLARLGKSRVWIIDPLDGTAQFCEHARTDWGVHVALAVDGRVTAATVALPAEGGAILSTDKPPSLTAPQGRRRPVVVASRSRRVPCAEFVAERFGTPLLRTGSVGAKVAAVIWGRADAYVHSGGLWEWDAAAPAAVARACGLQTSSLDGGELLFNRPHPYLEDLLIYRRDLTEDLMEALADFQGSNLGRGE